MARKRHKKKRLDYRTGGRVELARGGKSSSGQAKGKKAQVKAPKRVTLPATKRPVPTPVPVPIPQNEYRAGSEEADTGVPANIPPANTSPVYNPVASSPYVAPSTVVSEEPDISGGSDGRNNPDGGGGSSSFVANKGQDRPKETAVATAKAADTRNIYTDATEAKLTAARTSAEEMKKGETVLPSLPAAVTMNTFKDTDPNNYFAADPNQTQTGDIEKITAGKVTAADTGAPGNIMPVSVQQKMRLDEAKKSGTGAAETTDQQGNITASTFAAGQATTPTAVDAATGELSEGAKATVTEIRTLSGEAQASQIEQALINSSKAANVNAVISAGAYVPQVSGVAGQLSATSDAEKQTREAITGSSATSTETTIINTVGFAAAQRSTVQGTERTGAAAAMIAQTGSIPQDIAAAIVENPASVEAKIDSQPVEVQAAVAALPTEALISSQMETLVGGLESGTIPAWAKPAVDAMNQNLADRGMEVSTVGRDALFNAIIQSALPLAQSNAQALQTRAAQNLSNQQQANLTQSTQDMQRRMANLANQQTAASQTAQNAQQMSVLQSEFKQQAVLTSAQQEQQTLMANLQNQQQAATLNAQNEQAINAQNLSTATQVDLANLQIQDATARENMSAVQQERLAEYQTAAQFLSQNAAFANDMKKANLNTDQQMRLANLSAQNQAGSENLNASQQTELANLNKRMQMNIKNADLAQQMGLAQLNVDQQKAMQNATMVANMDLTKFTTEQQVELANSKFMQTANLTNLNNKQQAILQNATAMASLDLNTLDQRTKLAAQNAQSFLQMDISNLTNTQQSYMLTSQQQQQTLLSNNAAVNVAKQFNSTSENQTNQFMASLAQQVDLNNTAQLNSMEQFNTQLSTQAAMQARGLSSDENKLNAQLATQVDTFNTQLAYDKNKWNATNAQAVEQSNVAWRRNANTINTAAQNQINMQNAQNLFGMSAQAQSFLWQELRDRATYEFQAGEKFEDRKTHLLAASMSNDAQTAQYWDSLNNSNISKIFDTLVNVATDNT